MFAPHASVRVLNKWLRICGKRRELKVALNSWQCWCVITRLGAQLLCQQYKGPARNTRSQCFHTYLYNILQYIVRRKCCSVPAGGKFERAVEMTFGGDTDLLSRPAAFRGFESCFFQSLIASGGVICSLSSNSWTHWTWVVEKDLKETDHCDIPCGSMQILDSENSSTMLPVAKHRALLDGYPKSTSVPFLSLCSPTKELPFWWRQVTYNSLTSAVVLRGVKKTVFRNVVNLSLETDKVLLNIERGQ